MENQLETLSKTELVKLVLTQQKAVARLEKTTDEKDRKIADQQRQLARKDGLIAQLQRMLFGQKRERFESPENQMSLPFGPIAQRWSIRF